MRRNVDVPKHSKKRARGKIDPISINMYEVFANGRGRAAGEGGPGEEGRNETGGFVLFLLPSSSLRRHLDARTAGDREMLSETVVIA